MSTQRICDIYIHVPSLRTDFKLLDYLKSRCTVSKLSDTIFPSLPPSPPESCSVCLLPLPLPPLLLPHPPGQCNLILTFDLCQSSIHRQFYLREKERDQSMQLRSDRRKDVGTYVLCTHMCELVRLIKTKQENKISFPIEKKLLR